MDYTQSDSFSTHAGTGHRLHDDDKAIPTVVSADDMNMVIWSLMEVINAAGIAPAQFDAAVPSTYTKLLAALRAMGLRFSAFGSIAGTYSLTLLDLPKIIAVQANGQTITLPPVTNSHVGAMQRLFVYPGTSRYVTVQATGVQQISTTNTLAASVVVSADGFTDFIWEGTGTQHWQVGGFGVMKTMPSFAASLGVAGYQELPSDLIMQWGSVASASFATTTTSFPIAFPNGAPFQVFASGYNISGGIQAYVTTNDATATACSFNAFFGNAGSPLALAGSGQVLIKYFAFGRK